MSREHLQWPRGHSQGFTYPTTTATPPRDAAEVILVIENNFLYALFV